MAFASLALTMAVVLVSDGPHPPAVTLGAGAGGSLVVAADGMALYSYDGNGTSEDCIDECLARWPALLATPADKPIGDWVPRARPGGGLQWSYKRQFVYRFSGERKPGEASGDGVGGAWHALEYVGATPAVTVPAAAQVLRVERDFILADHRGRALYSFARDKGAKPACIGDCLEVWPPLLASALARPVGRWTPVDRPDGLRQWSYRGKLLYRFGEDDVAGDRKGDGLGKMWRIVPVAARDGDSPPAATSAGNAP